MGATPVQPLLISTLNRRIRWIGFEIRNKEKNRELKFFNDISFLVFLYCEPSFVIEDFNYGNTPPIYD